MKSLSSLLENGPKGFKKYRSYKSKETEVFDFLSLVKDWEQIVGPRVSKFTLPLKCDYKTLTILTNHPAFAGELMFMEEPIKKQIFKLFPTLQNSINRIKFQVNSSFFEAKKDQYEKLAPEENIDQKRKFHPQSPAYQNLKKEAEDNFFDIEEDYIKKTLVSLYIQNHS